MKNNRIILRSQQRFKCKKHYVFTGKGNKIELSANKDDWKQSIGSIETDTYGASNKIIHKNEEMKYNSIIKRYVKKINFDDVAGKK